jgi:hypothetical protein
MEQRPGADGKEAQRTEDGSPQHTRAEASEELVFQYHKERKKGKKRRGKTLLETGIYHIKHLFVQAFSGKNFYARHSALLPEKLCSQFLFLLLSRIVT